MLQGSTHSDATKRHISATLKKRGRPAGFNIPVLCDGCNTNFSIANFNRHKIACAANRSYVRLFGKPITTREFKGFRQRLRINYGITVEEYAAMFDKQQGTCAICHNPSQRNHLAVDHCHTTNLVRGLLCDKCNFAIGLLEDNPEYLTRATAYLNLSKGQKHPHRP